MLGAALVALGMLAAQAQVSEADSKAEVTAAVQRLFDSIAARDSAAASAAVIPQGRLFAIRADGAFTTRTLAEWAAGLSNGKGSLLERMWNVKVDVFGPMAVLNADYDFHVDGKFSHCGVDSVQLIRTAPGWTILSIAYTTRREGCPSHPAGPPKTR